MVMVIMMVMVVITIMMYEKNDDDGNDKGAIIMMMMMNKGAIIKMLRLFRASFVIFYDTATIRYLYNNDCDSSIHRTRSCFR